MSYYQQNSLNQSQLQPYNISPQTMLYPNNTTTQTLSQTLPMASAVYGSPQQLQYDQQQLQLLQQQQQQMQLAQQQQQMQLAQQQQMQLLQQTCPQNVTNGTQLQNTAFHNGPTSTQQYLITSQQIAPRNGQECCQNHMNNCFSLFGQNTPYTNQANVSQEQSLTHQIILKQIEKQKLETMLLQDVLKKNPFQFQFHYDCQTQTPNASNQATETPIPKALPPSPSKNLCLCQKYSKDDKKLDSMPQQPLTNEAYTSKLKTLNLTKSNDLKPAPDMATFMQSYLYETTMKNSNVETEPKHSLKEQSTETDKDSVHIVSSNQGIQCEIKANDYDIAEAIFEKLSQSLEALVETDSEDERSDVDGSTKNIVKTESEQNCLAVLEDLVEKADKIADNSEADSGIDKTEFSCSESNSSQKVKKQVNFDIERDSMDDSANPE